MSRFIRYLAVIGCPLNLCSSYAQKTIIIHFSPGSTDLSSLQFRNFDTLRIIRDDLEGTLDSSGSIILHCQKDNLMIYREEPDLSTVAHHVERIAYGSLRISHLRSYPADTIHISGLELPAYHSFLSYTSTASFRKKGELHFHKTRSHSYEYLVNKHPIDTIAIQPFLLDGYDPRPNLSLQKDTFQTVSHMHGGTKRTQRAWAIYSSELSLTYILDLADPKKLRSKK